MVGVVYPCSSWKPLEGSYSPQELPFLEFNLPSCWGYPNSPFLTVYSTCTRLVSGYDAMLTSERSANVGLWSESWVQFNPHQRLPSFFLLLFPFFPFFFFFFPALFLYLSPIFPPLLPQFFLVFLFIFYILPRSTSWLNSFINAFYKFLSPSPPNYTPIAFTFCSIEHFQVLH